MEDSPQFQILRALRVRADDGRVVAIAGARERALLTRLLVDVGRPVTDARLLEDLWPTGTGSARKSLQVRVSALRRQLSGVAEIHRVANGYRLDVEPTRVDAVRFEQALDRASSLAPAEAAELLGQALDWWTPAALADLEHTPAEVLRLRYERLARDGRRRLGIALVRDGRTARAVRTLAGLADDHPADESVATALVHALYADGRASEAVRAHRRAVEALAADGLDPSPAFRGLVTEVLRHDLPAVEGGGLGDRAAWSPAWSRHPGPSTSVLRPVVTPFLGRGHAVTTAVEALATERVRLLTLWGPGGVGKTRLALEVVERVAGVFAEPAIVVDGSRLDDPGSLGGALVRAAGLPERGAPLDVLAAGLAERQVLVVVDNIEHLLPGTEVLTDVLAVAPEVQMLVTSRAVLGLRHERVQPVEPLGAVAGDGEITAPDFLRQRAREMGAPDLSDRAALGRIATRLDGLPLALELAAARLRGMTPAHLEADLATRLDALGALHDLPDRQRTLQATVAWSAAQLDRPARDLLLSLGVFAAPARLDAIRAVSPEADLDRLMLLVDHALLRRVPTADGEGAFVLLETVRRWAGEQLREVGWADQVRARHAAHHAAEVAVAAEALETSAQASATLRLFELEADVERALRTLRDGGDDPALCSLVLDLWRWWFGVAATRTAVHWLQVAAASGRVGADRVRVLSLLAFARSTLGDVDGARSALASARQVRTEGDPPPELDVAGWVVALQDGGLDEARVLAERAGRAYDAQGRAVLAAEMRVRVGLVMAAAGDAPGSERANREALAVLVRHGPRWEEASVHNNLAHLALDRGDTATALAEATASLATFARLPFARDRWIARETLLSIHVARGELVRAREAGRAALEEATRIGDLGSAQRVRVALADLELDDSSPGEAARILLQRPLEDVGEPLRWYLLAVCARLLSMADDPAGAAAAATLAGELAPDPMLPRRHEFRALVGDLADGSRTAGARPVAGDLAAVTARLRVVAAASAHAPGRGTGPDDPSGRASPG